MAFLCWFRHRWTCIGSDVDEKDKVYYWINCTRCGKIERLYV